MNDLLLLMKKLIVLSCILLLVGCTTLNVQKINEVKDDDLINLQVTVRGNVSSSVKLGELSGYTLDDGTGNIFVSSNSLPAEGTIVTVTGQLKHILLGYYIETK